jgi:heme oxygenase
MLARLEGETSSFHAEADRGWNRLLRGEDFTRDHYVHQLTVTYGFESPFEAACSHTTGVAQLIDLRGRWRSGHIVQDLLALGCPPDDLAEIQCCSIAPFQDAAEALAWMYVVERPTLIHAELCEELTSRFVDLARATTYLRAYEGTASKRWADLGIALDRLSVSDKIGKRVIDAARAGFQAMVEWQRTSDPGLRSVG